ncbi:MAG: dihydrodipicolinate synthase family protein [Pseudomonadota bacterium]
MAHRLTSDARGVYIISATPFTDEGAVDHESLKRLVAFYGEKGVTGITILGMMGEAPKLSLTESHGVIDTVMAAVAGALPVVVGVSSAGIDNLSALADYAMEKGAAGVMVAPNAAMKTETGILATFEAIAARLAGVPLVYQDFPLSTAMPISPAAFGALVNAVPSVAMLKHEDWPGLSKLTAIRAAEAKGQRRVSILTGNGGLYLPQELARGADGAMTGFAFPEMLVEVVRRHQAGDPGGAEDLFDAYLPLVRHEQQPGFGLAVRKEILRRRGIIASAAVRAPGPKLDGVAHDELTRLMARLERRLGEGPTAKAA